MTERGLRWFALGLILALAVGVLSLLLLFSVVVPQSWSPFFLTEDAGGVVVIILGLLGFWMMRRGRTEHGAAHASNLRRATTALVLAAFGEGAIFLSGVALGYGILPRAIVISFSFPLQISPEWILRTVHFAGYIFVSVFVGLFLLWTIWQLVPRIGRGTALTALVAGVPTHIVAFVSVSQLLGPLAMPEALLRVSLVLPALSVSLWLIVYLLAVVRVRGNAGVSVASDVPT